MSQIRLVRMHPQYAALQKSTFLSPTVLGNLIDISPQCHTILTGLRGTPETENMGGTTIPLSTTKQVRVQLDTSHQLSYDKTYN